MSEGKSKPVQGGGELSGLLRQAEELQKELDRAAQDLAEEVVEARDANDLVKLQLGGDGSARKVELSRGLLNDRERKAVEDAIKVAVQSALERLFELRSRRSAEIARGLRLPNLFL